jgi:hypothetical protein
MKFFSAVFLMFVFLVVQLEPCDCKSSMSPQKPPKKSPPLPPTPTPKEIRAARRLARRELRRSRRLLRNKRRLERKNLHQRELANAAAAASLGAAVGFVGRQNGVVARAVATAVGALAGLGANVVGRALLWGPVKGELRKKRKKLASHRKVKGKKHKPPK